MNDNLVSVIIPTFNRSNLLSRAILSVINQTYKNLELLVIDDGSTDNTREIVEKFIERDKRIKYYYQTNKGQGSARNIGIINSSGEYIAFLDSDDEWLLEKIEKQIVCLIENSSFDFCYTADVIVGEDKKREIKRYRNISLKQLHFTKLAGIGISVPSSHIYKRKVFDVVGLFDEDRAIIGLEDNDWSLRGHYLDGFYLDMPLTLYYKHSGQITKKKIIEQIRGLEYIFKKHYKIILMNKKALLFRLMQFFYLRMKNILPHGMRSIFYKTTLYITK